MSSTGYELFFGNLNIAYKEQGPEDPDGIDLPLGVGTTAQLVSWVSTLRTDRAHFVKADLFPEGRVIEGIWIAMLPIEEVESEGTPPIGGRIPWEKEAAPFLLLLEGEVPKWALEEYDSEIVVKRITLN